MVQFEIHNLSIGGPLWKTVSMPKDAVSFAHQSDVAVLRLL
jgi:hypothetical protein